MLCFLNEFFRKAGFFRGDFNEFFIEKGDLQCSCKLFGDFTPAGAIFPSDRDDIGRLISSFDKTLRFSVKENFLSVKRYGMNKMKNILRIKQ